MLSPCDPFQNSNYSVANRLVNKKRCAKRKTNPVKPSSSPRAGAGIIYTAASEIAADVSGKLNKYTAGIVPARPPPEITTNGSGDMMQYRYTAWNVSTAAAASDKNDDSEVKKMAAS